MRYKLHQIEHHVDTHCTLKCENCDQLVPYVARDDVSYVDFCKDVDLVAELFDLNYFWLIGGEPTIHPLFDAFVDYASQRLPVSVVSNGTNILRVKPETLRKLKHIRISCYPEIKFDYSSMLLDLQSLLVGSNTVLESFWQHGFFIPWANPPLQGAAFTQMYNECRNLHDWKCYAVRRSVFFKCSRVGAAHAHAKRIGHPITDFSSDGLSMIDPEFLTKLPAYLHPANIMKACRICNGTPSERFPHKQIT